LICLEIKLQIQRLIWNKLELRRPKSKNKITVDGAPTVLNQKRWLLVLYVPMPAPALATCSTECQPRDEPQLQSLNDPKAGTVKIFRVATIILSGERERGDNPMVIYVVLKEHVKSILLQKQCR
jgi:hypothetical protein